MGNDDAKRLILARRARFVAAALASVAVTAGSLEACGGGPEPPENVDASTGTSSSSSSSSSGNPQPCLDIALPRDDAAAPQPCLSPPKGE